VGGGIGFQFPDIPLQLSHEVRIRHAHPVYVEAVLDVLDVGDELAVEHEGLVVAVYVQHGEDAGAGVLPDGGDARRQARAVPRLPLPRYDVFFHNFLFFLFVYSIFLYFCGANDMGLVTVRCLTARVAHVGCPFVFMESQVFQYPNHRFSEYRLS